MKLPWTKAPADDDKSLRKTERPFFGFLVNASGVAVGVFIALLFYQFVISRAGQARPQVSSKNTELAVALAGIPAPFVIVRAGCQACNDAETWLQANRPDVVLIRYDDDREEVAKVLTAVDSNFLPTLVVQGRIVQGFDAKLYGELLGRSNVE